MSNIKPSDHGIVVENKESGLRYASLDVNYDPQTERKVRDLKAGETVFSYVPRYKTSLGDQDDQATETGDPDTDGTADGK